jgi:hypothetical protein
MKSIVIPAFAYGLIVPVVGFNPAALIFLATVALAAGCYINARTAISGYESCKAASELSLAVLAITARNQALAAKKS